MNTLISSSLAFMIGTLLAFPPVTFAQNFPPVVTQKIQAARKQVKTIGMEEYRKIVENPGNALIVDVREPNEFAAGHVPGAINIPRGVLEFQIWKQVGFPDNPDLSRNVILQCQSGNRASLAAQSLAELGFTRTTAVGDAPRRLATGRSSACEVGLRRCFEEIPGREREALKVYSTRRFSTRRSHS